MNLLQKLQEKYLAEFSNNVPLDEFLLNILVTALLALILRAYFIRFSQVVSNRRRFGNNFMPLALGTLLIIMIVKSSIALSLGLVGALSIVRFRAAIKDPEELTFLFLAIGIGLAGGANQPILAVVAIVLILALLFLHRLITKRETSRRSDLMFVNIQTKKNDLEGITGILTDVCSFVELKRMDSSAEQMHLSFLCKMEGLDQLASLRQRLQESMPDLQLSVIDKPDLIV
jgi:uncharacterized membrane protein YhiD involved in acid resistance